MLGAIAGDMIGAPYEFLGFKHREFPLFSDQSTFTDDTILTVAVADALLHNRDFAATLKEYGLRFPHASYGGSFHRWIFSQSSEPYNSWGNGSAMRTSPIGFLCPDIASLLQTARLCAQVTHNHPEGIKGAQAVCYGIFLARHGHSKEEIRVEIAKWFRYPLSCSLDEIRPNYHFDESCQGTVPPAFIAFFESKDFESAVRNAISLGGDADTLACISGSLAEAFYGLPPADIIKETRRRLPPEFLTIIDEFYQVLEESTSGKPKAV